MSVVDPLPQTPESFLEQHPWTTHLLKGGVTRQQLASLVYGDTDPEVAFNEWRVKFAPDFPAEFYDFIKPYCALRWLILEDPPSSKAVGDAWDFITNHELARGYAEFQNYRQGQREKGKKLKVKVSDEETIGEIIKHLALASEHRDETAKGLWGHMHSKLDDLRLRPRETSDRLHPRKDYYEYDFDDGRRKLTRGNFDNIVAKHRRVMNHEKPG